MKASIVCVQYVRFSCFDFDVSGFLCQTSETSEHLRTVHATNASIISAPIHFNINYLISLLSEFMYLI